MSEPIIDYVVLGVPEGATLEDDEVADTLEQVAMRTVIAQYEGRHPRALLFLETHWIITSDWREVERFQPAHQCPTCIAGNDQAQAFLKEFPEKRLALGNLTYIEVW
jgi:hypothetical protein